MALVVKDGALLKQGDGLASGQACCCGACCTCESYFSFYANGALLGGGPGYTNGFGVMWIPNIQPFDFIPPGEEWSYEGVRIYESDGWNGVPFCDENGDLIVRVNIYYYVQGSASAETIFYSAQVIESRFYKFEMAGGGCGILTGTPVDPPEGEELVGGFGGAGVIEGQTIIFFVSGEPDDGLFRMDWSSMAVQASCQTHCTSGMFEGDNLCDGACSGGCECQETDNAGFYACRLNPLP